MYTDAIKRKELIPALIGAGICLLFSRSSLLALFFLMPLGFLAFRYGYRVAWSALFLAVMANTLLALGTALGRGFALTEMFWGVFFFAAMASLFTWAAAPPPTFPLRVCATTRLLIGSFFASLLLIGMFFRVIASTNFLEQVVAATNAIARQGTSGADVVQNALFAEMTPEVALGVIRSVVLRGGALISSTALFFLCRQMGFILARLFTRNKAAGNSPGGTETNHQGVNSLIVFRVHPMLIWVLSASLLMVVFASRANLEIPEIVLWNILILCCILYLAQGIGILQFFLARPAVTPFLKLLLCIMVVVLLFISPGINVVLFGGVVLLGIAENWVPFRVPASNGPPSTPEAGGDIEK